MTDRSHRQRPSGDAPDGAGPVGLGPVLAFLPRFQNPGFTAGVWRGGEAVDNGVHQMPWVEISEDVTEFLDTIHEQGVIVSFDWPSWAKGEGARLVEDPAALARADIDDLRRLLTAIVRQDRFNEGFLLGAFESGLMVRILQRLATLLATKRDEQTP